MPKDSPSIILILFGATGDLSRHKLLPTLRELWINGELSQNIQLVAVGRQRLTTEEYAKQLANDFSMLHLQYLALDFEKENGFDPLIQHLRRNSQAKVLFYMALTPDALNLSIDQFSATDFRELIQHHQASIVVEKPFGTDLADAHELNRKLTSIFGVRNIFRNDPYLFKNEVQKIIATRHNDPQFDRILNGEKLSEVQVHISYLDQPDMALNWLQRHAFQILAVLCADKDTDDFRLSKADFIESLKLIPETSTFTSELRRWKGVTFSLIASQAVGENQLSIELRFTQPDEKFGLSIELVIEPSTDSEVLDGYAEALLRALRHEWEEFVSQAEVEAEWRVTAQIQSNANEL
jgi:glucose-6-phosphate 1-dehydrogenase